MFNLLINSGLAIIPFFIWVGCDTRQPKMILAMILSLALSLYSFNKGVFKPYQNKWLLALIVYLPISSLLAPQLSFSFLRIPVGTFWSWESLLYILIFFLAHVSIASYEFTKKDVERVLNVIFLTGLTMAFYGIIQWFNLDQFFKGDPRPFSPSNVVGTLGNPDILSPFLAMIIPIAIYLKKYFMALLMAVVVIFSTSQVAIGSLVVCLAFLIGTKGKRLAVTMSALLIICALILSMGYFKSPSIKSFVGDSGRFAVWNEAVNDLRNPLPVKDGQGKKYAITGFGIGSFKYLFHSRNNRIIGVDFFEAHNEYLELLYNSGIIGILLFLSALILFIKQCFPLNRLTAHLLASFICIAVAAGGIFVWQLGATVFYTIVISGLLMNKTIKEEGI